MDAIIFSIGSELTYGKTVDTNTAWLAQRLGEIGVPVVMHITVPDELELVPEVVDAVAPLPVLAAGGIGCGRQMAAALALGAQGVWTGSIWLATHENDWQPMLKQRLIAATSSDTVRSRCISGKPARMLRSKFTEAWDGPDSPGTLPMPLQYLAVAEAEQRIRRAMLAGNPGAAELAVTPVGQIVGRMNQLRPARQVVMEMVAEYLETVERMSGLMEDSEQGA